MSMAQLVCPTIASMMGVPAPLVVCAVRFPGQLSCVFPFDNPQPNSDPEDVDDDAFDGMHEAAVTAVRVDVSRSPLSLSGSSF